MLLDAWMRMSVGIRGNRILKKLSFNEMLICGIVYRAELAKIPVTATDICSRSRLLKSQVNKLLGDMEGKGLIIRQRDTADKRRILITMASGNLDIYLSEHERVMEIVSWICRELGGEETALLTEKMNKVVSLMDDISDQNVL